MEANTKQIEELFEKSDFSRESGLKARLARDLFPVREVTLNELMEKEGLKSQAVKDESLKEKSMRRQAQRQQEKQAGKGKAPESLGARERENPLIKKGRSPAM